MENEKERARESEREGDRQGRLARVASRSGYTANPIAQLLLLSSLLPPPLCLSKDIPESRKKKRKKKRTFHSRRPQRNLESRVKFPFHSVPVKREKLRHDETVDSIERS